MECNLNMPEKDNCGNDCLAHSGSANLAEAVKCLKGDVIPKKIIKRVGYLVCTCKKKHTVLDEEVEAKGLANVCSTLKEKCPKILSSCSWLGQTINSGRPLSTSERRLLLLCFLCLEKNLSPLEPRPHYTAEIREWREKTRSPYIKKIPKSKRKGPKYSVEDHFNVPLQSNLVGQFVGKSGRNLYICERIFDCKVSVAKDCTVTIRTNSDQNLQEIKDFLNKHAASVMARRRLMAQQLQAKRMEKARRKMQSQVATPGGYIDYNHLAEDTKDAARQSYSLKMSKKTQDQRRRKNTRGEEDSDSSSDEGERRRHNSGSAKSKKRNVLEEGSRCFNCLLPYDLEPNITGSCRYHEGYIGPCGLWTCCHLRIVDTTQEGQRASHVTDGCVVGSRHNWRPHKKSSGHSKGESNQRLKSKP